ncbi:fucose isomerase [Truepera radiovictrix]|uniref:L-fucose isomerase_2 domain protein n=1 Tax=Truepera radiovictrix (strain DSM 17093 / CIP 108686 / LMG 22925 / RQ-24) TaxID=649638 RepID=D7CSI2_TRURR|nr:fucose isomerase [Truepera radiovictrix]ADI15402.1 L-fucose isomerase _2 domain protein [Truepera radiovictrix DSM 17093]WMT56047.1 fucose isomerase [Truepera radiovictrix]
MDDLQPTLPITHALLVASGDLRETANRVCWPAQAAMEAALTEAFGRHGVKVTRAHPFDERTGHGFISSQRMGMDVFRTVPKDAPLVVAEAVWQYSHHVLAGLRDHRGPILTVANWSGQWPGLVGMLNLNGSLTKAGVAYSTLWSETFTDPFFERGLKEWLTTGRVEHDLSHVRSLEPSALSAEAAELGAHLAETLRRDKAILGVFDEGCMGMYNAIIDDELLNPLGVYKERLSQSALVAEMRLVRGSEARSVLDWLRRRGVTFVTGTDDETELTEAQLLEQARMYVAAVRMAHRFGCDAVGIQYQQGLKDMTPASDLVEGLLNNPDRPPVLHAETGEELYPGRALPHFNEVDECAALDALVTNRVWTALSLEPSTTLHDLRWGEPYPIAGEEPFVWVFEISGAAPASHFVDGYAGARSERQPPMYFPLGGGTLKGVSKPGEIIWSRVFVQGGALEVDLGRATVVALPEEETRRRWEATTPQWPIMHAVLRGVTRDQMMARHKANHIQVAYVPSEQAEHVLQVKAAMFAALGLKVHLCGV